MSQQSKRELLETVRPRRRRAGRKTKQRSRQGLVAFTGSQRKYAMHVLRRSRSKTYSPEVILAWQQV